MKCYSLFLVAAFVCNMTIGFNVSAMDGGTLGNNDFTGSSPAWLLNLQNALANRWNSIPNRAAFVEWTNGVKKTVAFRALAIGIGAAAAATVLLYVWETATTHCKENCEENTFCTMVNSLNCTLHCTWKSICKFVCPFIPYFCQTAVEHITKNQNPKRNCQIILNPNTNTFELGDGCEGHTLVCNWYDITPKTDTIICEGHYTAPKTT